MTRSAENRPNPTWLKLLDATPDATLLVDREGRIRYASQRLLDLFGYASDALTGQPVELLLPVPLREAHAALRARFHAAPVPRPMGNGLRLAALRRDGGELLVEVGLAPLGGSAGLVLASVRDVTALAHAREALERASRELSETVETQNADLLRVKVELHRQVAERLRVEEGLRRTETLYRQIVETQPDLICRFLPDTTLTFVNEAYAAFFGCRPEDLIGKRYIDLLPEEARAGALENLAACMPSNPSRRYEHQTVGADGRARWHLWDDTAIFDLTGMLTGFQSIGFDTTERKLAEAALQASEARYRRLVEGLPDIVYAFSTRRGALYWSPQVREVLGFAPEEVAAHPYLWHDSIHPEDLPRVDAAIEAFEAGQSYALEYRIRDAQGRWRWLYDRSIGRREAADEAIIEGVATDITARKQAEQALHKEKERAEVTLHSIGDAVITTDAAGLVEYLNPAAEALTGWLAAQAVGRPLEEVFHVVDEKTGEAASNPAVRCLAEGRPVSLTGHCTLISRSGQEHAIQDSAAPICDRAGQVFGAVLVFSDVTEARRLSRAISYQASHDALTGLVNRAEFERRLRRALEAARAEGSRHALCYLDLDQFKLVNDTCGHVAGDELLRQLGGLLREQVRQRDTLARLGGDEFGVLIEDCTLPDALRVAGALRGAVESYRFLWEDRSFSVGVSIGLVPIDASSGDFGSVLSAADAACYIAKEQGRNRVHAYQGDDAEMARRHGEMQWAARLPQALEQGRLLLYAQRIVPLGAGEDDTGHYEVLLRMRGEAGEVILPQAFLPAAERYGLSPKLDRWVVSAVLRGLAASPRRLETLRLCSINLSGHSLGDDGFLAFVVEQLAQSRVPPEKVCFEITETLAIANLSHATQFIKALKAAGCRFALDDFGSGLSSFAYLQNLPVDYLKIDGQFVRDVAGGGVGYAIVKSINEIGHVMGKQTIAEFVEDAATLERLREIGVDYAQGFLLGHPQPIEW
jgi:diguanylate cyclase (GGDEF)-like protein/PAS domain S-box-containing protein